MNNNKHLNSSIKILLEKNQFLPISEPNWNTFSIKHYRKLPDTYKDDLNRIAKEFKNKSGIYCYKKNGEILYIGQGSNLTNRIRTHYRTAFKQRSSDRTGRWYKFFSVHTGQMKIYWQELDGRFEQIAVEHMLKIIHKPRFDK